MGELYDTDVVEWSEQQGRLLRRHAAGEQLNKWPDWDNIVEEVESVGRSQVEVVESLWTLAFLHALKVEAWPDSRDGPHWRAEARLFRRQARRQFTPAMRSKISLSGLYGDALAGLPDSLDGRPGGKVTETCPVTLDELLAAA
jgi:hypothetical protein